MLTPQDIENKQFVKAVFGGYDTSTVDDFLEEVMDDYAALYKENAILKGKIKVLVEKVEEYRSTEDAMRMALLTAQKMGDDLVKEAKEKSQAAIAEADAAAQNRKTELEQEILTEQLRYDAAKKKTSEFVEEGQALIRKYAAFLQELDQLQPELPVEEPAPAPTREEIVMDAAVEISKAVSKAVEDEIEDEPAEAPAEPEPPAEEPAEEPAEPEDQIPTKRFKPKPGWDDEDEPTSPRPKFNFDDLQFGINYPDEE